MSNTDVALADVDCVASSFSGVLHPREVPLGGPRAIRVRRTLPQRERSLIGAWCFADHYRPHDVRGGTGMDVPPHPHTGLQTVSWLFSGELVVQRRAGCSAASWLFSGEVDHRDSAGVHALVHLAELNLMTAGAGICHSEVSTADTSVLHGVQLWVALPDSARDTGRDFAHYAPRAHSADGVTVRVFLGELEGDQSPVHTFTPLLGAPFDEQLVMWWNFVGRSHDDIAAYRDQWENHDARFGAVDGYRGTLARLPAPPLPNGRLRPRTNPGV